MKRIDKVSFTNSTPTLSEFDPEIIPYQSRVINDVRQNYDYDLGVHEMMLSGSVGSAKSILMAHLALTHVIFNSGARFMLGRQSMPDLKDTLVQKIHEHIGNDLKEGVDYSYNETKAEFNFRNGSQIITRSWGDKKYRKFRSLELSGAAIEELTENSSIEFQEFYKEVRARIGRLPHVKENFIVCATNPDSPAHAAYDYFIDTNIKTRHVYYSVTSDNPFLPKWYIEQLKEMYTTQECLRMIYGQWLEISAECIYYGLDVDLSVVPDIDINPFYPICISFDFNIGEGKPMSVVLFQYIKKFFYFFTEVIISGARTLDVIDEIEARGIFDLENHFIINGDATGKARSTNYNRSDYDVIRQQLSSIKTKSGPISFEIDVPLANPPVRKRHTIVNGQLKNAHGKTHIFISKKKCPTIIKGLKLTRLKSGGNYIENDSDPWQHCTTALGYGILRQLKHLDGRFQHRKIF